MSKESNTSRGECDVERKEALGDDSENPKTLKREPKTEEDEMDQPTKVEKSDSSSNSSSSDSDSDTTYANRERSRRARRSTLTKTGLTDDDDGKKGEETIAEKSAEQSVDMNQLATPHNCDGASKQEQPQSSFGQPIAWSSKSCSSCCSCSCSCSCSTSNDNREASHDVGEEVPPTASPISTSVAVAGSSGQSSTVATAATAGPSSQDKRMALMLSEELVTPAYVTRHFISKLGGGTAAKGKQSIKTEPVDDFGNSVEKKMATSKAKKPSPEPADEKRVRGRPKGSKNRGLVANVQPPATPSALAAALKKETLKQAAIDDKPKPSHKSANKAATPKETPPASKRPSLPLDAVTAKRYKNPSDLWAYMEKLIRSGGDNSEAAGPSGVSSTAENMENQTPSAATPFETPKTSKPSGRRSSGLRFAASAAAAAAGPSTELSSTSVVDSPEPADLSSTSAQTNLTPILTSAGGFVFEVHSRTPLDAVPVDSEENIRQAEP